MEKPNLSGFKAIILAGGKGTRLYPITKEIPKPLIPVNKKPIISHLVDLFRSHGITDIAVLINREAKDDFYWWKKRYYPKSRIKFVEETQPLGSFGGLYLLKKWIGDSSFFLTNGDELKEIELVKMVKFHKDNKAMATVALVEVEKPSEYGIAVCEENFVKEFIEKPTNPSSKHANAGLVLFNVEVFKYHKGPSFQMYENDIFPVLAKEKKLAGFKFKGKWMDTGTWERYGRALEEWK